MGRPRVFDWSEAQRLRAQGLTYATIALRLGTSATSVACACDPALRERQRALSDRRLYSATCPDCGGPRNRYNERCQACSELQRATTVRPDALRCARCHEWKPDEDYHRKRSARKHRRGRHQACRPCNTIIRRESRQRARHRQSA